MLIAKLLQISCRGELAMVIFLDRRKKKFIYQHYCYGSLTVGRLNAVGQRCKLNGYDDYQIEDYCAATLAEIEDEESYQRPQHQVDSRHQANALQATINRKIRFGIPDIDYLVGKIYENGQAQDKVDRGCL